MLVKDVMIKDLSLLTPLALDEDFTRVRSIFRSTRFISWIPVIGEGNFLAGIIKRDCVSVRLNPELKTVIQVPEYLLRGDDSIEKLLEVLTQNREDNLLVTNHEFKLIGFVSRRQTWVQKFIEVRELIPYDNVFDALYDAILILDRDGRVIYGNNSYTRVVGVSIGKILGKHIKQIEPSDQILTQVLRTGIPSVNTLVHINSLNIDIFATVTPILKGGEIFGVISSFRNYYERTHLNTVLPNGEEHSSVEYPLNFFDGLIGRGRALKNMLTLAEKASKTDLPILIIGESGVGKEIVAKSIHGASGRSGRPMLSVNCAAIPDTLLESELFGYMEGSFTGARKEGRVGKFQMADRGTLFLDEVGEMSAAMQAKLLRVIQDLEIHPLGTNKIIKVNVRLICATNKELENLIKIGQFRSDLYYRLNVIPIHVPPLRKRREDIPLLVEHFLEKHCRTQKKQTVTISNRSMDLLMDYDWPGNVRELENAIEYALVNVESNVILPEHLPSHISYLPSKKILGFDSPYEGGETLSECLESVERKAIQRSLLSTQNNKSQAMKILGISRRTFYSKLKKYGFDH